jgi:hypothetical protein
MKVNVKDLTVSVTYRVGLGDVKMPHKVYKELIKAQEKGDDITMDGNTKYIEAYDWLSDNIKERDCMDWSVEIEEIN